MLRRISLFFLLLFSLTAWAAGTAGLNYTAYVGGGASPTYTQNADGTLVRTLLSSGTVSTVNYNWSGGNVLNSNRGDGVIVRFYGYINIATAGTYYFGGNADDGIRIKVNNTSVVNSWIESGGAFRSGSIYLEAGTYPIELMYYENAGGAMVNLQWNTASGWQIVGSTYLATDSTYFAPPAPTYSSSITNAQATRKASETTQRTSQSGNQIYIDQAGDNNNFTIRQGVSATGKNRIELTTNGSNNTLNINQGYTPTGTATYDSNDHYQYWNITGSSNNITTQQSGSSSSQFMEGTVSGGNNTIDLRQTTGGNKVLFFNANGSSNNVTATQSGTGNHYLDINLTGNGHTVNTTQTGSGNHAATIDLTNGGGASSVNLTQSGSTAQVYSIQQTCTNPAGCSVTVTQP